MIKLCKNSLMVSTDSKVIYPWNIGNDYTNATGGDQGPTLCDNCGVVFQYLNKALNMTVSISFNGVCRFVVFWNVQTWENTKQKTR